MSNSTVKDLLTGSLRLLGAIATGETPSSQEMSDAMDAANGMLDSWSNESLVIPSNTIESFPLTAGVQQYTLGVGGTFNTVRPLKIENVGLKVSTPVPYELPVKILNDAEWASIILKGTGSNLPTYVYPDNAYPLNNLYLWPVPAAANSLVLYTQKALTQFATINDTISLPPGYWKALRFNLALELAAEYGKQPSEAIIAAALESKENIKRNNIQSVYLHCDEAVAAKPRAWNWLTGETT